MIEPAEPKNESALDPESERPPEPEELEPVKEYDEAFQGWM